MQLADAHFSEYLLVIALHTTTIELELDPPLGPFVDFNRTGPHRIHPTGTLWCDGRELYRLGSGGRHQAK